MFNHINYQKSLDLENRNIMAQSLNDNINIYGNIYSLNIRIIYIEIC